jgi:hypothetical protein
MCYKRRATRHSSVAPPQTYRAAGAATTLICGNTAMAG